MKVLYGASIGFSLVAGLLSYLAFAEAERLQSGDLSDGDGIEDTGLPDGTKRSGVRAFDPDSSATVVLPPEEAQRRYIAGHLQPLKGFEYAVIHPDDNTDVWVVPADEVSEAVSKGYVFANRQDLARVAAAPAARERGGVFLFVSLALAALGCGLAAYRLLRMVLDRFVAAKWSCLAAGLMCLATGFLISGFVLGLVELSRLPKVEAT